MLFRSEVHSVEITNPIILGEAISDKEIRLDIHVRLNNKAAINLEMQVVNHLNWQNRSLLYLSRSYDSLNRGQDYLDVQPAILYISVFWIIHSFQTILSSMPHTK